MKIQSGLNILEKLTVYYLVFFMVLGIYLSIFNQAYFDTVYTLEDGLLEWLTVVALFTTAAVTFNRAVKFASTQSKVFVGMNLLFAAIFLFGAGEEISWGQRIFGWETTDYFSENNAQNETNIHNLKINGVKINQLIFGTIFSIILFSYLLILAPLYHRREKFRQFFDSLGIPMPKLYQVCGYFVILIAIEVIIKEFSGTLRRGELTEFVTSFWVLINVAFPTNKIFSSQRH